MFLFSSWIDFLLGLKEIRPDGEVLFWCSLISFLQNSSILKVYWELFSVVPAISKSFGGVMLFWDEILV